MLGFRKPCEVFTGPMLGKPRFRRHELLRSPEAVPFYSSITISPSALPSIIGNWRECFMCRFTDYRDRAAGNKAWGMPPAWPPSGWPKRGFGKLVGAGSLAATIAVGGASGPASIGPAPRTLAAYSSGAPGTGNPNGHAYVPPAGHAATRAASTISATPTYDASFMMCSPVPGGLAAATRSKLYTSGANS